MFIWNLYQHLTISLLYDTFITTYTQQKKNLIEAKTNTVVKQQYFTLISSFPPFSLIFRTSESHNSLKTKTILTEILSAVTNVVIVIVVRWQHYTPFSFQMCYQRVVNAPRSGVRQLITPGVHMLRSNTICLGIRGCHLNLLFVEIIFDCCWSKMILLLKFG